MSKITVKGRTKKPPEWYICGSFVIDILYGSKLANDIDVAWLRSNEQPDEAEVRTWIASKGIDPRLLHVRPTPVKQIEVPEIGGFAYFNIDCWRLDRDGKVYSVDPNSGARTEVLKSDLPRLVIVGSSPPPIDRLEKVLDRITRIPALYDEQVRQEVDRQIHRLKAQEKE